MMKKKKWVVEQSDPTVMVGCGFNISPSETQYGGETLAIAAIDPGLYRVEWAGDPGESLGTVQSRAESEASAHMYDMQRCALQAAYKQQCTEYILSKYPEAKQRSAALGIYEADQVAIMKTFIAACIAEENRVYDLLESAIIGTDSLDTITPLWPE
jgi:hypothetical protein